MKIHTLDSSIYKVRREALMKSVGSGRILILGNRESSINFEHNWYPYRQDSTFLYYAGLNIPNVDLLLDCDSGEAAIIGQELTMDDIIWTGPLPSLKELGEKVAITKIEPPSKLSSLSKDSLHYLPPYRPEHTLRLSNILDIPHGEVADGHSDLLVRSIITQRNIKSQEEIDSMHEACTLTSKMHAHVMEHARQGMYEYELVGLAKKFGQDHNTGFSFTPICTTRGHVLHNHSYDNKLKSGDMVLLDGGLESSLCYAGDMTRTWPVDRKFSAMQADVYQIVLNAQKSAIKRARVGMKYYDVHLSAARKMCQGLSELGLMKGDPEEAAQRGAHTLFFQHGLGHLLGLDVHDMENFGEQRIGYDPTMVKSTEFGFRSLRLGHELQDGYVITIEPGIYFIPQLIDKFEAENLHSDFINYKEVRKYQDLGGIRIEDDYLIRESGIELLGEPLVKEIKDVEAVRSNIS